MSLVMAIANKEGIVVSADWRLIRHRTDNPFIAMPSDHSQKAYITKTNHVVAFTGDARLDTGEFLNDVILHTLKLQEMVEFLQGINCEIAEIDSLVSPKCDIITVTSKGAQRLYTPERYGWIVDP